MLKLLSRLFRGDRGREQPASPTAFDPPPPAAPEPASFPAGEPVSDNTPATEYREFRILIVDDSPTVTTVLSRLLQLSGYQTMAADEGASALSLAERERPDLVFLDIVLPGMSGFAVLRALRRKPATQAIPVIMISGNLRATEEFYGQRIGADDFIKKPFGRSEVLSRIQRLVDSGRLPAWAAPDAVAKQAAAIANPPPEVLVADDTRL